MRDQRKNLWSVALLLLFYLGATQLAHTLLYTIVAYLVSAADKTGTEFGNTVNEIAGQYHFLAFALAALLMTVTTWLGDRALYRPGNFWNAAHKPLWQLDRPTKRELVRGFSSGALAAGVFLFLFTFSGQGSFLGVYITSTFGTPVFPLFFVDFFALGTLLFCEEYIFRHKILPLLLGRFHPTTAVVITTALALLVKQFQFDLEPTDFLNLALLNLSLGYFYLRSGQAHRGIAFTLALVGSLHSLSGLPLWGCESPSFFLFKANQRISDTLFGSGPFAGLALSSIFLVFLVGAVWRWRQEKEARRHEEKSA